MSEKSNLLTLEELRSRMTLVNETLVENLNDYFTVAGQIGRVKDALGLPYFDAAREAEMISNVVDKNPGPVPDDLLKKIFREIFSVSIEVMMLQKKMGLQVNRLPGMADAVVTTPHAAIGGKRKVLIGGPCAVESRDQMMSIAQHLHGLGINILRGGAFKPRTSPYSFQGLEEEGLRIMRETCDAFEMDMVTEVLSARDVGLVSQYADILQVGTRNMFNYTLLKELGQSQKPVFLKRGLMATIDEFVLAAEYVYAGGNTQVILCERGIRTFENQTRNTLDISAVPILKNLTPLPVIVDVSHSLGRKDIIAPVARAALAAGADGIMFEAHSNPEVALSDCEQQLTPDEVADLVAALGQIAELS
ncbi:bifunctional 3-deoxy-7-phosphoheptulonate synthase/chorismate mutase [Desulfovibrio inopinatus]|uniref:bifunctional 3-deoxy-7-phosphoheptulonate synthase/chorismate mutase n=1 Tax=Desulfovibrio inopinatus TaxID=102109 RepID=UPI000422123D|nr:bifunctional 3-deoxy-7-phosphoheptulonate synthase/chorismate mutase [Desulfovibrio inopinatus]